MATRKSATKSVGKKAARPAKKTATKRKAATTKKTETKKAMATKERAPKKAKTATKAAAPAAAAPKKSARTAKAARSASPKETKTTPTTPPTPAREQAAPLARKRSGPPRTVAVTVGSGVVSKLGTKWTCFECGSRFYDLNKPEPLCPKCGADQRQRPKVTLPPPSATAAPKKAPRPMAPLLDDEDDGTVRYDEEFDLGVRTDLDDTEEDLFPAAEIEEDDVFGAGDDD